MLDIKVSYLLKKKTLKIADFLMGKISSLPDLMRNKNNYNTIRRFIRVSYLLKKHCGFYVGEN